MTISEEFNQKIIPGSSFQSLPVTLIIPHWERFDDLQRCVDSVLGLTRKPEKILIIDDCSLDNSPQKIARRWNLPLVELVALSKRIGTSEVKNLGLFLAKTPFVWFLDSDTETMSSDALATGLRFLCSEEGIGVVGGEIVLDINGRKLLRETMLCSNYTTIVKYHEMGVPRKLFVDVIATNNFLCRVETLKSVGGFCRVLKSGEDKLASIRISRLGFKLIATSEFGVIHHCSRSGRVRKSEHWDNYLRDNAFIFGAVSDLARTLLFIPINFISLVQDILHRRRQAQRGEEPQFEPFLKEDMTEKTAISFPQKVWRTMTKFSKLNNFDALVKGMRYNHSNAPWESFCRRRIPGLMALISD